MMMCDQLLHLCIEITIKQYGQCKVGHTSASLLLASTGRYKENNELWLHISIWKKLKNHKVVKLWIHEKKGEWGTFNVPRSMEMKWKKGPRIQFADHDSKDKTRNMEVEYGFWKTKEIVTIDNGCRKYISLALVHRGHSLRNKVILVGECDCKGTERSKSNNSTTKNKINDKLVI